LRTLLVCWNPGDFPMRFRQFAIAALGCALIPVSPLLHAQFNSASLNGIVKDVSGSVVPDASVTITNTETGLSRADKAASDGAFLFPVLPVGTYRLTVEKTGFSTYVQEGI